MDRMRAATLLLFVCILQATDIKAQDIKGNNMCDTISKKEVTECTKLPDGNITELHYEYHNNRMPDPARYYDIETKEGCTTLSTRDPKAFEKHKDDYNPMEEYRISKVLTEEELANIRNIFKEHEIFLYDSYYSLPPDMGRVLDGDRWSLSYTIGGKRFRTGGRNVHPKGNGLKELFKYFDSLFE